MYELNVLLVNLYNIRIDCKSIRPVNYNTNCKIHIPNIAENASAIRILQSGIDQQSNSQGYEATGLFMESIIKLDSTTRTQADLSWDRQRRSFSAAWASALRNPCTETDPYMYMCIGGVHVCTHVCVYSRPVHSMHAYIPTPCIPWRKNACA